MSPPVATKKSVLSASVLVIAIVMLPMAKVQAAADPRMDPVGVWLFEDGDSAAELYPCGDHLCGRISWLKDEHPGGVALLLDKHNPDPALASRPVCGLEFISGLKPTGKDSWEDGHIYSIGGGSVYDLDLTIDQPNHIRMRGYQGVRFLGQSFSMSRAPADLPSCSSLPPRGAQ